MPRNNNKHKKMQLRALGKDDCFFYLFPTICSLLTAIYEFNELVSLSTCADL